MTAYPCWIRSLVWLTAPHDPLDETVGESYYSPMTTTTVTLPDDLYGNLKEVAAAEHRSANATIVVAVSQYVHMRDRRAAIRAMAAEIARVDRDILDRLAQ